MPMHITPEAAAQRAGCSRWTIVRALKAGALQGFRDNRGRWQVSAADLERWAGLHSLLTEQHSADAQPEPPADIRAALAVAEAKAEAAERARDQAEADRDHWRRIAETLAARRRWWPF